MKATYLSLEKTINGESHIIKVDDELFRLIANSTRPSGEDLRLQSYVANARNLSHTRDKLSVALNEVYACLMTIIGWTK